MIFSVWKITVELFLQNFGHFILLLILLGFSAFFSGCETAFFNLSKRQIDLMKISRRSLTKMAAALLNEPGHLLSCFLFGNMIVNVLYFAIVGIITVRISRQLSVRSAAVTSFILFSTLVLFGELLPKSLAYLNSRAISIAVSLPAYLFLKIFKPVIAFFKFVIVDPSLRLMLGPVKRSRTITEDEFRALIAQVKKRGVITADQNRLINEIIELGSLQVSDCLKPRVDMIACSVTDSPAAIRRVMIEHKLTKIPIYAKKLDNIIGFVQLRQSLLEPDKTTDKLVQPVHFIPEQKSIESLLELFRKTHTDTAVVVDEYGGIAGTISLEDIAEELLGPIEQAPRQDLIESIGPFRYRLGGNIPIHDWADAFDIDIEQIRVTTIGGLVTALLGRIPKTGDMVGLFNLKFTVEAVHKRRIKTVVLTLETMVEDG